MSHKKDYTDTEVSQILISERCSALKINYVSTKSLAVNVAEEKVQRWKDKRGFDTYLDTFQNPNVLRFIQHEQSGALKTADLRMTDGVFILYQYED